MARDFSQDGNSLSRELLQSKIKQEWRSLLYFMVFAFFAQNCSITLTLSKNSGR